MSLVELTGLRGLSPPQPGSGRDPARPPPVLAEGEILTVVGESGCGKSTLDRVILGLQKPTAGTVSYLGEPLQGPDFRWRTVGAILRAPLRQHRPDCDAEALVRHLLTEVGLTPPERYLDAFSFQLSGGQRQRVALARAGLLEPRLVGADEPISGVDAAVKLEILDLIRRFNAERDTAFVYITHDLATASLMGCSRLLVLYLSQIVELGPMPKLLEQPGHPYLQALLSAVVPPDPEQARQRPPAGPGPGRKSRSGPPAFGLSLSPRLPALLRALPRYAPGALARGRGASGGLPSFSEF